MFKKVTPRQLFPTHIWTYDVEDEIAAGLNIDLMKSLDELTPEKPKLAPGRQWQTDQNLHEFEEFGEHPVGGLTLRQRRVEVVEL